MKLWMEGVRIFKGLMTLKYIILDLLLLKKKKFIKNKGDKTFLKKWGITIFL